jgi:hypothetical protein
MPGAPFAGRVRFSSRTTSLSKRLPTKIERAEEVSHQRRQMRTLAALSGPKYVEKYVTNLSH